MGGGRKLGNDVPRRGGRNILREVEELSSGAETNGQALASSEEFCAREHRVGFRLTNGRIPEPGETVSLLAGKPPELANAEGVIGVVESGPTAALNRCLGLEWTLSGTVASIDAAAGKGTAMVSGEH